MAAAPSPATENRAQERTIPFAWYAALFGFAVLIGILVLWRWPEIYGGDPTVRITNWQQLRLAYQLPGLQALVHLAARITPDPVFLRLLLIAVTAAGACGMARLAAGAFGPPAGISAGLLFASNHFLIYLGNSAYQEVLELTLLLWGLAFIFSGWGKWTKTAGHLLLAGACLTRYEAWLGAAAGALVCLVTARGLRAWVSAVAPFSLGPLLWMVLSRGFSPAGTIIFDPSFHPARLWRIAYVSGATLHHTTSLVTLLAAAGVIAWWKNSEHAAGRLPAVLLLAAVLFLATLPLTAMGVLPDYDRYVTNREVHFLLPGVFLFAGRGLQLLRRAVPGHPVLVVFLVVFAYEGYAAKAILDQSVREGNLQLDVSLARLLSARLGPADTAVIFTRPYPEAELEHFFEALRRKQGPAGPRAAREMMARMNTWPLDYARIWVHAPRVRPRLLLPAQAETGARPPAVAVVFDDYAPRTPQEQTLLEKVRQAAARNERVAAASGRPSATLYWTNPPP